MGISGGIKRRDWMNGNAAKMEAVDRGNKEGLLLELVDPCQPLPFSFPHPCAI
jgi:hypothetical protein